MIDALFLEVFQAPGNVVNFSSRSVIRGTKNRCHVLSNWSWSAIGGTGAATMNSIGGAGPSQVTPCAGAAYSITRTSAMGRHVSERHVFDHWKRSVIGDSG